MLAPRIVAIGLLAVALAACAGPGPSPSGSAPSGIATASTPASVAASVPQAAATWERLDDAPFARLEMAVTAHGGRIWLAGGLSAFGDAMTEVDIYDPATASWTDGPALPSGLHHAALVSDGARLLLIGGYLGADFNRPTDLVLVLADGDTEWREGPPLPDARAAGAAAWDGDRVVYAGGVSGGAVVSDVFALADDAWIRLGSMAQPREHLAATSDEAGTVWLLGGRVGGLDSNMGVVETVSGTTIAAIASLPTPRGGVAAFHVPGLGACLTGGEAPDRAYTTVECITSDGTITTLPELNEPHHGHGAAVIDAVAYVLLGGPRPTLSAGATVEALAVGR